MATLFNHSGSTDVRPASFFGMEGWFAMPDGWYLTTINGQQFCTPNADLSRPLYALKTNEVGALVFMDLLRSFS